MTHHKTYGAHAEEAVVQYLHSAGYTVCDTNYTTRYGEIDIIARTNDVYVFIEVKARTMPRFAMSNTITPSKQAKIIRTAQQYMYAHNLSGYSFRFDVALVTGTSREVSYIPHAFTPEDVIS